MTEIEQEEQEVIVLTDEEGKELECIILDYLEVDKKRYVVIAPVTEEEEISEEDEIEVDILRVDADEKGEEMFSVIEDDEEWDKVADAWQELQDEEDEEE